MATSKRCHPLEESEPSFRSVLAYLREMVQLCQNCHRADLEKEYQETYLLAAQHIYGKLPARREYSSQYTDWKPEPKPAGPPKWMRDKYANPMRKVVDRITDLEGFNHEVLECGHQRRVFIFQGGSELDPSKPAQHRRCKECMEKKPVQSANGSSDVVADSGQCKRKRTGAGS